jgi:hypothetical protein
MKLENLIPTKNELVKEFHEVEILSNDDLNLIKGGRKAACGEGCKDSCKGGNKNVICGGACATGGKTT